MKLITCADCQADTKATDSEAASGVCPLCGGVNITISEE